MQEKILNVAVLGLGGCGGNVLASVFNKLRKQVDQDGKYIDHLDFTIINTDVQALNGHKTNEDFPEDGLFQIGERATRGLGAGSDPDVGRVAALEDVIRIRQLIEDKDLVIAIVGLGGGTGSGITPVILDECVKMGIMTLTWSIIPFEYEGPKRNRIANKTLLQIERLTNSYVLVSNDAPESLTFKEGVEEINDVVSKGVHLMLEVLATPTMINLDFADFTTVLGDGYRTMFSYSSHDGSKRAERIGKELLEMKLQPGINLKRINKAVVFIRGGLDMRKDEIKIIMDITRKRLDKNALVLMGVAIKEDKDSIDAMVLGTTGGG